MAVSSSSTTPSKDANNQTSAEVVTQKRNKDTKKRELRVSKQSEVKEIDLVESGSEDGEIVEVDDVDKETHGKDFTNGARWAGAGVGGSRGETNAQKILKVFEY